MEWQMSMEWRLSHRGDRAALPLADRHYNRQKPGTPQFVPPGRCVVLLAGAPPRALWVSSWPFAEYVRHAWAGAWMCTCFRNEGAGLSSALITEAVAVTRWVWGMPPPLGMVTFVNPWKVNRAKGRAALRAILHWLAARCWHAALLIYLGHLCDKAHGWCYRQAGFKHVGWTEGGLVALQLLPAAMPDPAPSIGAQLRLLEEVA